MQSHAAPRSEAADPSDLNAMRRLSQQRVEAGTGVFERERAEAGPQREQPQAGAAAAEKAAKQQAQQQQQPGQQGQQEVAGGARDRLAAGAPEPAGPGLAQPQQPVSAGQQAPAADLSGPPTVDGAEAHLLGEDTAASRGLPANLQALPPEREQPGLEGHPAGQGAAPPTSPAAATPAAAAGGACPAATNPPSCSRWCGVLRFEEEEGSGGGVPMRGSWWQPDGTRGWHHILQPGER